MATKNVHEINRGKEKYWKKHFKEWEKSGKIKSEYCKQAGISYYAFGYWRTKLKAKSSRVPFVQIPIPESFTIQNNSSAIVLLIKEKYRIEINEHFNSAVLSKLIQTLEEEKYVFPSPKY